MLNPSPAEWGDKIAPNYDQSYGQHGDLSTMAAFLAQLATSSSTIVEVGAGTGRVAAEVASLSGQRVVGIDVSNAMIATLHTRHGSLVEGIVADICENKPDVTTDLSFCVFNSLFMMGPADRQASALRHMREMTVRGGTLVVENFQPIGGFFEKNSTSLEPVDLSAGTVHLAMSRVNVDRRVIEGMDIVITEAGNTLAPCTFHYRTCGEVDQDAATAGWRLRQRYSGWLEEPFSDNSDNAVSVYEAV